MPVQRHEVGAHLAVDGTLRRVRGREEVEVLFEVVGYYLLVWRGRGRGGGGGGGGAREAVVEDGDVEAGEAELERREGGWFGGWRVDLADAEIAFVEVTVLRYG